MTAPAHAGAARSASGAAPPAGRSSREAPAGSGTRAPSTWWPGATRSGCWARAGTAWPRPRTAPLWRAASVCDVAVESEVEAAVAEARAAMGGLDGVFVNAGTDGEGRPAVDLDVGHFRRVLDVNVIGAFLVARAALRGSPPPCAIVFNASVNALRPELNFLDYNASKAAVVSMAKSLALETSASGTAVTALCPGLLPDPHDGPVPRGPGLRGTSSCAGSRPAVSATWAISPRWWTFF